MRTTIKNTKILICVACSLFQLPGAHAQLIGSNVFLQGKYVELGIAQNGAFGSSAAPPAGYHARTGPSSAAPGALGFVADPDKDGWATGSPAYIGDYFTPGNPQEGWDIEINGLRGKAWRGINAGETGTGFSGLLAGANTSMIVSGRKKTATWTGTMGDLSIVQQTSLDTERVYFTVTVSLKNTGDTTLTNIYYDRTVDPDNRAAMDPPASSLHFITRNRIVSQLPNPDNDIFVSATDTVHNSFLGLGTKDCRAKCYTLFTAGDLHPVGTLKDIFAQSPAVRKLFKKDTSVIRDVGMGLIFNIGSIDPGDSTSITYTYILKEGDLDTALIQTKPTWLSGAVSYKSGDTFRACKDAVLPVAISNGDGLVWGAWSVSTGLSSSSGRTNNITVQSTPVTYKVVGISSACYNDTMTLTVAPHLPLPLAPVAGSPVNFCVGGPSAALTATGTALQWYTASSGGTPITAPTPATSTAGSTTYYVSQTTAENCESPRTAVTVTVNALPAAPVVSTPVIYCQGIMADTLTATGTNLKWYTTASGGSPVSTPTPATSATGSITYYVSQTTGPGCESNRATLTVNVQPLPVVSISSLSVSGFVICKGKSTILKANAATATGFQWKFADTDIAGATQDTAWANKTGSWGVTVTDGYGCKGKTEVFVQEDSSKRSILTPSEARICHEGSALLTCSPGYLTYTFQWMKAWSPIIPATPKTNIASMSEADTYRVIVTNNFGCIDTTNAAVISYHPVPLKPAITQSGSLLSVPSIYRYYQWYLDNKIIYGANKNIFNATRSSEYAVEVTDENGCLNRSDTVAYAQSTGIENVAASAQVSIYPNPTKNLVHIEAPFAMLISITDMTGRVVMAPQSANTADLGNYADGMYLLRICDLHGNLIKAAKVQKRSE